MKKIDINNDWRFKKEESDTYEKVDLPHDAMINESRSANEPTKGAGAYFSGGTYIYEKQLFIKEEWRGMKLALEFEGVYRNSKVYINGKFAGGHRYGYSNFYVYIDEFADFGKENNICVIADNSEVPNSRWYSGSGIYRPVHLCLIPATHIEPDGITIKTIDYKQPKINVNVLHNGDKIHIDILDGTNIIASASAAQNTDIELKGAKLWSAKTPFLYTCRIRLEADGKITDSEEITFGIRALEYNSNGIYINGKKTLLRGGCIHHDNGILGAACYQEAEERKIKLLKEYGFNAIRSAHNPASKALLDACDKLGMYVMDEAFDMWYTHKNEFDYASDFEKDHETDLCAMINKDKNHPCVIMYSIGNEITEPHEPKGVETARRLVKLCKKLDDTRPVTAGVNLLLLYMAAKDAKKDKKSSKTTSDKKEKKTSAFFNELASNIGRLMNLISVLPSVGAASDPFLRELDICGYNYASTRYKTDKKKNPQRLIIGSETMPYDIAKNWKRVKEINGVAGDFMWTAIDYLGETGIGGWSTEALPFEKPYPWIVADCGALDIIGNPTGEAALAKTVWGDSDKPLIFVRPVNNTNKKVYKAAWRGTDSIPSWGWKGCNGNKAAVEVYSDNSFVELYLNGRKITKKAVKNCCATFHIPYEPGTLKAVAFDKSGHITGTNCLSSPNGKIHAVLKAEGNVKKNGVSFVELSLEDENGNTESNRDAYFDIEVKNAQLLAFGSAVQKTEDKYSDGHFITHYGKALAVIKTINADRVEISASSGVGYSVTKAFDTKE